MGTRAGCLFRIRGSKHISVDDARLHVEREKENDRQRQEESVFQAGGQAKAWENEEV